MIQKHWPLIGVCTAVVILVVLVVGGTTYIQNANARASADPDYMNYLPQVERVISPQEAPAFVDTFDDPTSGWYVGDALRWNVWLPDAPDGRWEVVATMDYFDSSYHTFIPLTFHSNDYGEVDTWFVRPVHFAPLPDYYYPLPQHYCVEVEGYFSNYLGQEKMPWWATWGLVFGADEAKTQIYTFQINANHDRAAIYYSDYVYPGDRQTIGTGDPENKENFLMGWLGHDFEFIQTHHPNTLKAAVNGGVVTFWVNDYEMGTIVVPNMHRDRVGVIVTSWETTPVEVQMPTFRYDPQCAEAWE